jgi:hypothetical protein
MLQDKYDPRRVSRTGIRLAPLASASDSGLIRYREEQEINGGSVTERKQAFRGRGAGRRSGYSVHRGLVSSIRQTAPVGFSGPSNLANVGAPSVTTQTW